MFSEQINADIKRSAKVTVVRGNEQQHISIQEICVGDLWQINPAEDKWVEVKIRKRRLQKPEEEIRFQHWDKWWCYSSTTMPSVLEPGGPFAAKKPFGSSLLVGFPPTTIVQQLYFKKINKPPQAY